jgi:hypothetical protein
MLGKPIKAGPKIAPQPLREVSKSGTRRNCRRNSVKMKRDRNGGNRSISLITVQQGKPKQEPQHFSVLGEFRITRKIHLA